MIDIQNNWQQIVTLIGTIVWAVRVEGKVKTLETLNESQTKDIKDRLVRIENKIDRSNGTGIVAPN
jgi:hypothetical protein